MLNCNLKIVFACLVHLTVIHSCCRADDVRFGTEVLPILSANCFACHGPDEADRKANLRLDVEADAKARHDGGIPVVPGDVNASTLIQRILSTDADLKMPPADSHKELKPEQIQILKAWIEQGAAWGRHWSFEPTQRPAIEAGVHPIDQLVERRLREKGLSLRTAAAPHQLAKRLSLDLIGLPPTVERAEAFAANPTEAEYEKLIDELLASPQFGEHWARLWMDLARYADTKGYEKDLGRTVWPYRDWLIRSINDDIPLDQMTIEQLAGDLLPNATQDQLVATAFHRNTMCNDEGGTDDEEFRSIAVKDRVDTTMQVWMGLTAGCAKCHSHKYDPISHSEYYSLYAIFNQTQDADRYDDSPTLELLTKDFEDERKSANDRITTLRVQLSESEAAAAKTEDPRWRFAKVTSAASQYGATLEAQEDSSILAHGESPQEDVYSLTLTLPPGRHTVLRLEALTQPFADGQVGVGRNPRDPNFVLSELEVELLPDSSPENPRRLSLIKPRADFAQDGWPVSNALDGDTKTGWAVSPRQRERHSAMFEFAEPLQLEKDGAIRITMRQHYGDSLVLRRFRFSTIAEDAEKVDFPAPSEAVRRLTNELAAANKQLQDLNGKLPKVPVFRAMSADQLRTTNVHRRGNFLDPGDSVTASLPSAFHQVLGSGSVDRLVLAKWLMSPENTLTSRVWANRIWARLFGIGIVETEEDFGALGALPTNPELLDWLALEYRDGGWSLKKLLKSIVMSRTYRQSSETTPQLLELDPRNQLMSRGARFRLTAEAVRDEALAVSGLLSGKLYGPPVMPPQPDGLWRSTYNGQKWINAEGEDRYRRALYTYLKRTTPYPSMTTFDGGSGEVCQVRRIRTNTPLQALVTLNDPAFLEAAAALATKMITHEKSHQERATLGLRTALIRPVKLQETEPLLRLQKEIETQFRMKPTDADNLIKSTRATCPPDVSSAEFASWIVVANTILNLDEFLVRN